MNIHDLLPSLLVSHSFDDSQSETVSSRSYFIREVTLTVRIFDGRTEVESLVTWRPYQFIALFCTEVEDCIV